MFAFLNNAHEANIAVYTPRASSRRSAEIVREIREIEELTQAPATPTGPSGWPRGRRRYLPASPTWVVVQPEVDEESTGGQKYHRAGRRLVPGPGIRADQAHGGDVGEDHDCRRSRRFASSCSTTRTCRWPGPGRSIKGTGALTEFDVEAAPADGKRPGVRRQVRQGDGRRQSAGNAAGSDLRRQQRQASG